MAHTLIALAIQAIIAIPSGNWWDGAAAGAFYFIGREHSQREEITSPQNRDNPFPAFKVWAWSIDEQLDLLFPVIAVLSVAIFMDVK